MVTPTLDTSAYAPGDILFNPIQVPRASACADEPSYCVGIDIFDLDDQSLYDIKIVLLSESTSLGTINSAPTISDANLILTMLGMVTIAGSTDAANTADMGGAKFYTIPKSLLPVAINPTAGTPNIYIAGLVGATGTPTHTASGMRVRLWFQDVYPF